MSTTTRLARGRGRTEASGAAEVARVAGVTAVAVAGQGERARARRTERGVVLGAVFLSIIACAVTAAQGSTLAYKDGISHLEISRRVVDSTSAGFGQLGGVWLPLPHLLTVPLVWVDALYYSGFAATAISMVSYVVTALLLYRTAQTMTGRRGAGLVAAAVFALNANVLYMQSTPMTEMPLFAAMVGMVHGAQRWAQTDRPRYLLGAGVAGLLGSVTRYEAWVLLAALTVVLLVIAWRRRRGRAYVEGSMLAFLYVAGLGVGAWMVWNLLIFGNPLNFQIGEYAKPSLWVGSGEDSLGHPWIATQVYSIAVRDNVGLVVLAVAAAGLVAMLVRERLSSASLPTLAMLALYPFFIAALTGGQRPLHVPEIGSDLYNVRFGLLMVLPAALLVGYLVGWIGDAAAQRRARGGAVLGGAAVAGALALVVVELVATMGSPGGPVTHQEPTAALATGFTKASDGASAFLRREDDGGTVLMESFGNELVLFNAHVDLGRNVYEGSYRQWEPALEDPAGQRVRWVVMRGGDQPDQVHERLSGTATLDRSYRQVFDNGTYTIYERRQA